MADTGPDDWVVPSSVAASAPVATAGAPARSAPALPSDGGADDWVTPDQVNPAPVSTAADVAKAVPSGLAVGTAAAAGAPGGILDAIGNASEYGLQRLAKWTGLAPAGAEPQSYADIAASNKALTKGTDVLPRTDDMLQVAHDQAGFTPYEPKTMVGQLAGKTAEYLPATLIGPGGLATKGAMAAGSAAGDMAAGAVTKDTWAEPYARAAGALAGGVGGALTIHGVQAVAPAFSESAARAKAAGMILDSAHDPDALRAAAAAPAGPDLVPGSKPTSFQQYGDIGLGDIERAVNTRNPQAFVENAYGSGTQQQNAAQVAAMRGVQTGGNAMSVPDLFLSQKRGLEDFHDLVSTQAERDAQGQADALGGAGTATQTGQAIKSTLDPQFNAVQDTARSSTAALGGTDRADVYGSGLRGEAQAAADASAEQHGRLFDAVPSDMTVPLGPVQQFGAGLYKGMGPALKKTVTPAEADIADVLGQYGPQVSFGEARNLDTLITSSMRAERKANGSTPAYARMVQIKGAWEDAVHGALGIRSEADDAAVAAGTLDPSQTTSARLQAATGNGGAPGAPAVAFTPAGTKIGTDYGVADLSDLIASHGPDGTPNPAFPAELQPRDRTRAASQAQVSDISSNLQPERLGHSTSTTDGAPIIGPDGVVESGNGRVMALHQAYDANGPQAAAYRDFLTGHGYDLNGMDRPVLVRQRTTPVSDADRVALAQESNAPVAATMSAPERAASDAGRMGDDVLSSYQGGDINSAANRPFVRNFVGSVPAAGERGALAAADGTLSMEGGQRIRNALLHAGYGDGRLVSSLVETGDPDIAAFGRSLQDNAGGMAQLRRRVEAGDVHPGADLSAPAVEAARVVQRARGAGQRLGDAVAQTDAFNPISEDAKAVLRAGYGADYAGRLNRGRLSKILGEALDEAHQQTTTGRLFDEPLSARQMIDGATARNVELGGSRAEAAGASGVGAGDGAARAEGRGPGAPAGRPGSAGQGGRSDVLPDVTPSGPPVTQEALDNLKAAKDAFKEHVATYRKGPVGAMLRSDGTSGSYRMADSAVPGSVFPSGPKGYQAVQAYRQAVGDNAAAADMLHNYAASTLRKVALNDDGTLNPAGYSRWLRQYGEAVRALPDNVRSQFDTAGNAARALDRFGAYRPDLAPSAVPEMFFAPGKAGAEGVDHLRSLMGDQHADAILSDHAAAVLKAKAERPDGTIDPRGLQQFLKSYGPAMERFPELADRFGSAAKATQTIADVAAGRAKALKDFQATAAGKFLGLTDPTEVRDAVGRMIERNDVTGLGRLMKQVQADPAAVEGVKRAAADHVLSRGLSYGQEAGASGAQQVNKGTFQNVVGENRAALSRVFDADQMKTLDALSADMMRQKRSVEALKMKGSPNTAADAIRAMKFEPHGHRGSLLREMAEAAIGGEELGGAHGAEIGVGLAVGNKLRTALRDAGMRRTYDVLERAVLDRDFFRGLMQDAPKTAGTGSHVSLAGRLGRYSMYRGLQADTASQDNRKAS